MGPAFRAADRWVRENADLRDEDGRGVCLSNRQLTDPTWLRLREALTREMWPETAPRQLDLFADGDGSRDGPPEGYGLGS